MTHAHPRVIPAAAVLTGCLLLAACSSTSSSTTHATAPAGPTERSATRTASATPVRTVAPVGVTSPAAAACALVTEQDATHAIGADPGAGRKFASQGSSQCQYGTYQTALVLVNLTPTRGTAGYDLLHNKSKLGQAGVSFTDVAGLGDRAFEISGPHTAGIYVNKGDALIVVSVVTRAVSSTLHGQALALAKIAAGRI